MNADRDFLPLREAAAVLGVTVDALRTRVRRGTLAARKEPTPPYRWLVAVPAAGQAAPPPADASARLAALEAENTALRRELAAQGEALRFERDQAERLAVAHERLTRALPPPRDPPPRRRWRWWG